MVRLSALCLFIALLANTTPVAYAGDNKHSLTHLVETGALKVASAYKGELAGLAEGHSLSMLVVTLAPGVTEPVHTHPGDELLLLLEGTGTVQLDGQTHALTPGTALRVNRGQKKALSNTHATQPLRVLACLVLENGLPPIAISDGQ